MYVCKHTGAFVGLNCTLSMCVCTYTHCGIGAVYVLSIVRVRCNLLTYPSLLSFPLLLSNTANVKYRQDNTLMMTMMAMMMMMMVIIMERIRMVMMMMVMMMMMVVMMMMMMMEMIRMGMMIDDIRTIIDRGEDSSVVGVAVSYYCQYCTYVQAHSYVSMYMCEHTTQHTTQHTIK